jgi:ribosomal protein S18 acetylase RimI-like enzyme
MLTVEVVHAFEEDVAKDIVLINQESFPRGWAYSDAKEYYTQMLRNEGNIHIILKQDGERIGYLLAIPHNNAVKELQNDDIYMREDSLRYYIEVVAILPNFRGRKGFSALLKRLEEELGKRGIYKLSMHARVLNNFSRIIQNNLKINQIRRIQEWKYYNYEEPTDYIEGIFEKAFR